MAPPPRFRKIKPKVLTIRPQSHSVIKYNDEYDNDFGMSDDELLYREMNPYNPWFMGPSKDKIMYDTDDIDHLNPDFDS